MINNVDSKQKSLGKMTKKQAATEIKKYIHWYNNKRIHSSLNYMTPVEYRLANMTE